MKFYCFNVNSNDDHDHHMMRQGKEVFCKNLNIEMDKMSSEAPQKSIDSVSFNGKFRATTKPIQLISLLHFSHFHQIVYYTFIHPVRKDYRKQQ